MNNVLNQKYIFFYIFLCLALHILSTHFSIGFYSDDEHFQILEPIAYLLGLNDKVINDLEGFYWEWQNDKRMRPWLQPVLFYHLIKILKFFNFNDPFVWTFIIRLFSSIIGFISIIYLFFSTKNEFFKKNTHFNYLLFFTFWFFPFLHSRTSSENLGLSFFIIALSFFYNELKKNNKKSNYLLYLNFSFFLGLALVFKFNLIFSVIPIFLWILLFRFNFLKVTCISIGILIALGAGLIIDSIYWGFYTNTYLQFYNHNIILGRLNAFGTEPWWFYIPQIIIDLAPLLSLFFIFSLVLFWIKKTKSIFTWITLFTLIIISFIGHKETRYAFSIYIFAPLFISFFFENFKRLKFENFYKTIIIVSNIIFLILTLFTPANSKVDVYKFLFNNYSKNENVYYLGENPYMINDMEAMFYTHALPKIIKFDKNNLNSNTFPIRSWIITNENDSYELLLKNKNCLKKYNTYPEKIINLNDNWKKHRLNWYIFFCS